MFEKIPERAQEDSIECPRKFSGTFREISRNFQKDSGELSKKFRRMLLKISRNVQEGSGDLNMGLFCEILVLNCYKTMEENNY